MANNDSSQQYAPGVTIEWEGVCNASYVGKAAALIACGLVQQDWLPGMPGNGKGSQGLIFLEDGSAQLLKPRSQFRFFDIGFGGLQIRASGSLYHVRKIWSTAEAEVRKQAFEAKTAQETWQMAKQAHAQAELPQRWKDGVLYHVDQAEKLIDGRLVFTDFPDIGIGIRDIEAAKQAFAELRNVLTWATPRIKDKLQINNVVSLSAAAFRCMSRG